MSFARTIHQIKHLFLAFRPKQWIKNLLLFTALIFSLNERWDFSDITYVAHLLAITTAAFILFCFLSSAEYLVNDLADLNADRQHPKKRERPLASGRLNPALARAVALLLPLIVLPLSCWLSLAAASGLLFGMVATCYYLLALSYSLFLKKIVILDVFTVSFGFVLRVVAGGVVIGFPISPWLYICTFLLALFLALAKRRQELQLLEANSSNHRLTLIEYMPKLLDEMIILVSTATVVSYCLYTFSAPNLPQNHAMMLTVPFVFYGIFRYLYLAHARGIGGSPEDVLLKDKPLIITVFLWALTVILVLFFSDH